MKRLIPYAGAERRPAKQARSAPTRAATAPVGNPIDEFLMGENPPRARQNPRT